MYLLYLLLLYYLLLLICIFFATIQYVQKIKYMASNGRFKFKIQLAVLQGSLTPGLPCFPIT